MADIYEHTGTDGKLELAAADGNYVLGEGSEMLVSTLILQIVVASGTVSITPKGRIMNRVARRGQDAIAFQPIPYVRRNVNGSVSDDTAVSAAIAATGIFKVDISGLQPSLEIDQTDGVGAVYWRVVEGAAA